MNDIRDKVAKLLALAENNPSEGEAKAALLKARALMAEYKLRPEECVEKEKAQVIKSHIGIAVTGRKYAWAVTLSAIIAKHYCCISYRTHTKGSQTQEIGFVGMEMDFDICTRIFRYAFECVKQRSDEIFKENTGWLTAQQRRKNAEAYGWAFCDGVRKAFEAQQEEHQEWGLVLVVPKQVRDTDIGRMKPKCYGNRRALLEADVSARMRGYEDGLKFDPAVRLSETKPLTALRG